jgi:V/A-type H+-transporting ATPase subunit I
MKYVRLLVLTEDLPHASLALAAHPCFHADNRAPEEERLSDLPSREYRDLFQQARSRLDKITRVIPQPDDPVIGHVRVVPQDELERTNDWLGNIWESCSRYQEQFRAIDDEERLINEQQSALQNFENLNIDLGMLRSKTRFLDFYVGIVPRVNLRQLDGALSLADQLLFQYMVTGDNAHVVIVGPTGEDEAQLTSVLSSAGFQHLPIPPELNHEPQVMRDELKRRRAGLEKERTALRQRLEEWSGRLLDRLHDSQYILMLAEPLVSLDPSIRSKGQLAHLAGWVPAADVGALSGQLQHTLSFPFELTSRDPRPDERQLVPTVPVRNRFLQPFSTLVKQYGIPKYGELDPTPLFAVTFLLMFGMMFGDVGHGAVIAAAAFSARRKLKRFTFFGVAAGTSSMAFGFLFGSIFGYEDILPALWMSPLHDPILMLEIALGWGIFFIITACLLGIYNRVVTGDLEGAVFGHHGAVNLLFYLAFLAGGFLLAQTGIFGTIPALIVALSLVTLAVYQWHHISGPTGEKILIVAIETLDTVIVYLSNTLSFLRVSAFSLNHVALSSAIFTLANLMGVTGHWITVLLGNLFILVLEGGIVMIQVMRLQYYEGFSRYFSGDGHEFAPLRLRTTRGET